MRRSSAWLAFPLLMMIAACATTKATGTSSPADEVLATVEYGPDSLRIELTKPQPCCGDASTEMGGATVKVYLAPMEQEGASFVVYLGEEDQTVLKGAGREASGHYSIELFRSKAGTRGENGDVVMEIPAGVLPLGPLRMWTAHRVPTRVQGVALPNRKAGTPRPILVIKQQEVASSSSTPLDAQVDGAMPLDGETAGSEGGATTGGSGTED